MTKLQSPLLILRRQFFGFAITGTLSTLLMFGLYLCFNKLMSYQYAYLMAYSISVLALYFMNVFFVFKGPLKLRSFIKFPLIYLLQYLVGAASLEYLVQIGIPVNYAPLVIVIILLPVTFLLNRIILL